jgi:hypothetical protein
VDCKLRGQHNRQNLFMDHSRMVSPALCELIAPLCATQVPDQGFFLILDCPSESNARERVNTTLVTMVKGSISAKQLEDEFGRILPEGWRWTTRKVVDNMFTVRFPNAFLI